MVGPQPAPPFAKPIEPSGEGFTLDAGFSSPYFATDAQTWIAEVHAPHVLVVSSDSVHHDELIAPCEAAAAKAEPLVILAPGFTPGATAMLIANKLRGILYVIAIETPRGAEVLAWLGETKPRLVASGRATTIFSR